MIVLKKKNSISGTEKEIEIQFLDWDDIIEIKTFLRKLDKDLIEQELLLTKRDS